MFSRILAVSAAVLAVTAGSVVAQNYNRRPTFGTVNLSANFAPDPYVVNVTAGGNIPAERIGGPGCVGSIADPPDVRLNYRAGGFPLFLSATSNSDVTLVINLPNGRWICNDDFKGTDPGVVLSNPQSGQYDIWVGHYNRG
ncbi:MAG: peptidase and chymotrypsin/Hap, partial [Rubritepida sp.]|nr:peptidase and chymotrypsin/Hap [Rubritepida sp.]